MKRTFPSKPSSSSLLSNRALPISRLRQHQLLRRLLNSSSLFQLTLPVSRLLQPRRLSLSKVLQTLDNSLSSSSRNNSKVLLVSISSNSSLNSRHQPSSKLVGLPTLINSNLVEQPVSRLLLLQLLPQPLSLSKVLQTLDNSHSSSSHRNSSKLLLVSTNSNNNHPSSKLVGLPTLVNSNRHRHQHRQFNTSNQVDLAISISNSLLLNRRQHQHQHHQFGNSNQEDLAISISNSLLRSRCQHQHRQFSTSNNLSSSRVLLTLGNSHSNHQHSSKRVALVTSTNHSNSPLCKLSNHNYLSNKQVGLPTNNLNRRQHKLSQLSRNSNSNQVDLVISISNNHLSSSHKNSPRQIHLVA